MASPAILDLDALLRPIAEGAPTGGDLREDISPTSHYYRIKDARTAARAAERQADAGDGTDEGVNGTWPSAAAREEWRKVFTLAPQVLAEKSKDMEVVAWLIESLARLHGFAGLRDGFAVARRLVEEHWDGLYPRPDEDGIAVRIASMTGLNGDDAEGTLIGPIARIVIVQGGSTGPFAHWHYKGANGLAEEPDPDKRAKRIERGATTLESFQRAVNETPVEAFRHLVDDLAQCREEFAQLCAAFEARCGSSAPPGGHIRNALESVHETLHLFTRDLLRPPESAEAAAETPSNGDPAHAEAGTTSGAVRSREDAFRKLAEVADFFRRTEPHSPLSYLLDQGVRWGRMPLPELLSELIPDESARNQYFKLSGIQKS